MKSFADAAKSRLLIWRDQLSGQRPPLAEGRPPATARPLSGNIGGENTANRQNEFPLPAGHSRVATQQDIFYCFRLLLDRNPNPEEWPGHSTRAGEDLGNVVAGFVTSHEFTMRGLLNKVHRDAVELVRLPRFSLFVSLDDLAVGQHVRSAGSYDPSTGAVLSRHVKPGMTVVDVGANIGYFTMLLATLVTPRGCVFAIEPNPDNIRLLEASRRVNGFDQVQPIAAAAGRGTGILVLDSSYSNGMTGELPRDPDAVLGSRLVPCFALDTVLPKDRRVDLLKIDIEGAEFNAVIGLSETIDRDRPIIVSEFSPGTMPGISHCTGADYLQHLIAKGYSLGVVDRADGAETMLGEDADAVMRAFEQSGIDHIDIIALPK